MRAIATDLDGTLLDARQQVSPRALAAMQRAREAGVEVIAAEGFERIHRTNLIGMGVLPLQFEDGVTWQGLGLTGEEIFDFPELSDDLQPGQMLTVLARQQPAIEGGSTISRSFNARVRIDTPVELEYYRHGGILPLVVRKLHGE